MTDDEIFSLHQRLGRCKYEAERWALLLREAEQDLQFHLTSLATRAITVEAAAAESLTDFTFEPTDMAGNIRRARQKLGLSQCAFADKVGAKQSNVSKGEKGDHTPSPWILVAIANALGESSNAEFFRRAAGLPQQPISAQTAASTAFDRPMQALELSHSLRGVCSRVARKLGVTRSHVHRVVSGERVSASISAAVAEEIQRSLPPADETDAKAKGARR